jgi:outer membrane protein assembly factor BamB
MTDDNDTLDFEVLGEPVRMRELSFSLVTQDPDGYHIAWAGFLETVLNSTALVGVRTDTGEVLHHDLSKYGEGKITITKGADGNVYVYAGNPGRFFRYVIEARELEDLGVAADPANYYSAGALAPDGKFYVGSYPNATLVCCDTNTGEVENLGRIADDEKQFYIFPSVAASDDNVVYCPVGLHHKELWSYIPKTGERKQILPAPLDTLQGTTQVWTGEDGRVYGKADEETFLCLPDRIVTGKTVPARPRTPLLAGDKQVGTIDETGHLALTDRGTDEVIRMKTDYRGKRAWIYSVSCEHEGKVYGSCALPGRSFCYDTDTEAMTDLGVLGSGHCQVYDTIGLPEGMFLCSYMGAYVDVLDPDRPIKEGVNPRCLGRVEGQERPIQWCVGPDGMLYTGTEPAKGRLGGTLMRVNPKDESLKVWPTPIANQSVEYLAPVPETGELFCTTSIRGGSSAIPTETSACVFLWDTAKQEMVFRADPVPGQENYGRAVRGHNGLIYGLAGETYYVFDPKTRSVVFTGELPVKSLRFPHLNREPVGPRGLIVGLGDDAVYCIDPADNSARVLGRHPSIGSPGKRGAHGFFVTPDGVLYFGSEATLMRCRLAL